jgi:hypothetical protein
MDFTLTINCDNAAFHDDDFSDVATCTELARILRKLADHLERDTCYSDNLFDINGNKVGKYEIA